MRPHSSQLSHPHICRFVFFKRTLGAEKLEVFWLRAPRATWSGSRWRSALPSQTNREKQKLWLCFTHEGGPHTRSREGSSPDVTMNLQRTLADISSSYSITGATILRRRPDMLTAGDILTLRCILLGVDCSVVLPEPLCISNYLWSCP